MQEPPVLLGFRASGRRNGKQGGIPVPGGQGAGLPAGAGGAGMPERKYGQRALACPECGNTVYPGIAPVVMVAVTDGDSLCYILFFR